MTEYDAKAERYAAGVDAQVYNRLYERPNTLALLPETLDGLRVLDAGCGPGWYADYLAGRGAIVTAVDASGPMAEIAARRVGDRVAVHHADMADLSAIADDESFDLIVSPLAIHYVPDLEILFTEWRRVLKPGGLLVFSTHHPILLFSTLIEPDSYRETQVVEDHWPWLGTVEYYHRSLENILNPLSLKDFYIEKVVEPGPGDAIRAEAPDIYDRIAKTPFFLFVRARKSAG